MKEDQKQQQPAQPYAASKYFKLINLAIYTAAIIAVFLLSHFNILQKIELVALDLQFKLRGSRPGSTDIVMVDMDEGSINQIGRWPWSREWHASLVNTMAEYGDKITAFDIFFSEPNPLIDFFLIEATRTAKNVVFALAFEYNDTGLTEITREEEDVLDLFTIGESQITGDKTGIPRLSSPITPLPELYKWAKTAGHVITIPDPDGSIRQAPMVIECQDKYYLHFSLENALAFLGLDNDGVTVVLGKYIDLGNGTRIPIDKKGFTIIDWAARWGKAFKHISYWQIIASHQQALKNEQTMVPLQQLKDKLCIIGLTATGLIDIKPIPLSPAYPIVGLHANIINSVLENKFIKRGSNFLNLFLVMILCIPICALVPRFRPLNGTVFTLTLILSYLVISHLIFRLAGLWINVIYPLTGIALSFAMVIIHTEIANAIERTRLFHLAVEDGLTKLFVVRHFKEILDQEISKANRYKRPLSILMSDIDHFKRFNDTYGHQAGDFVLKEVAAIFRSNCRDTDIPGRYGGEEFIILLPETDRDGAVEFSERLRAQIEARVFEYNDIKLNVNISIGVAQLDNEPSGGNLIKRADEALYVAKETGRNKVCFS